MKKNLKKRKVAKASYRDVNNVRHFIYRYAKTKKEAKSKLAKALAEASTKSEPVIVSDNKYSFKEIESMFVKSKANSVGTRAKQAYNTNHNYLLPLAEKEIHSITENDLIPIFETLVSKGNTHNKLRGYTKQVFDYAVKRNIIVFNPAKLIERVKYKKKNLRILTSTELECLRAIYPTLPVVEKCYLTLLTNTGMRRSEIGALEKSDFDFNQQLLHVGNSLEKSEETGEWKVKGTKTFNDRYIPIFKEDLKIYKEMFKETPKNWKYLYRNTVRGMFPKSECKIITPDSLDGMFERIKKRMIDYANKQGIAIRKDLTQHMFRHTFATTQAKRLNVGDLSFVHGDSDIRMVYKQYYHADPKQIELTNIFNDKEDKGEE